MSHPDPQQLLKRVLIISPYFPPTNAADMHRVRMSLPYFKEYGWEAEVVTVHPSFSDMAVDPLLEQSLPGDVPVHYVSALSKKWTSRLGLGSIALRSLWFFRKTGNRLLRQKKFDLVYFSTTQFPVCILGAYWKRKFGVPYVIDVQDPWHSDYYKDKPRAQRPPKYWFSYRLNKTLEPLAMNNVDGLIAVSEAYRTTLANRYANCRRIPGQTIPFGAFEPDLHLARQHRALQPSWLRGKPGQVQVVYVGRGGKDMRDAVSLLFRAFRHCLEQDRQLFSRFHFSFIGTSYAARGKGEPTIFPLAREAGVADHVTEVTDRIPFYQTLNTLADATALFIPGSNDPQYTASKIYPYVLVRKPLLALFHPKSSAVAFLKNCRVGAVWTFDQQEQDIVHGIKEFLVSVALGRSVNVVPVPEVLEQYSAKEMTSRQCDLFRAVLFNA
ncbi:glycosyltransferase [Paraflavisolibacter sp. H34]|uniref:glycosyltransferase n=1 Tax=Huijunlia imazamoxiresistens TaxID=3127457 RepID=UPI00301A40B8